jgi:hypothetical protein
MCFVTNFSSWIREPFYRGAAKFVVQEDEGYTGHSYQIVSVQETEKSTVQIVLTALVNKDFVYKKIRILN